jgi:hypothetical protein
MVELLIKIIKHGITILFATPKNVDSYDKQPAKIMFEYKCKILASTIFSPFMIMIGRTPCLRADNYLHFLIAMINNIVDVETIAKQFLQKMKLVVSIHENVLLNVEETQMKQKKTYVTRKRKSTFEGFVLRKMMVKMKKPRKK